MRRTRVRRPSASAAAGGRAKPGAPARSTHDLGAAILELLDARAAESSVCTSEVARAVGGDRWRALMPDVREAAARLAANGAIEVTQRGHVVDVAQARGPVRLRRPR